MKLYIIIIVTDTVRHNVLTVCDNSLLFTTVRYDGVTSLLLRMAY